MKKFFIILFLIISATQADTCIDYHKVGKCYGNERCIGEGTTVDSCVCEGEIYYIEEPYEYECSISIDNIPSVMELKQWSLGAQLLNHWFDGNGETKRVKLSELSIISTELKDALSNYKQKAINNSIITNDIKEQLIKELKNTNNGQGGKIIPDGGSFDHISTELSSKNINGWDDRDSETKYMHFLTEKKIGNIYDLNEFTASIGRGSLRMVTKGSYYNGKLNITGVGLYLRDSFDFIKEQDLGCWSYQKPYVGRTSLFLSDPTCVNNKMFRAYAEYYYNDPYYGQYRIFSDMKTFNTNQIFYLTTNNITRAEAIKYILDKFNISSKNAGFNTYRFGEYINIPNDVNHNSTNYDYIVTAYNRGIVSGSNGVFEPNREITLAEFLVMIIRAIPIPINNPNYKSYDYHYGDWYYKYLKVAYNAGLIDDLEYSFDSGINQETANNILNKAYNYFMGKNSGISIYGHWTKKYVDFDVYLYSQYDGDGTSIDYDKNNGYVINNIDELRQSGGIVYWNLHSSNWGANLDYDSWGGNGEQPWAGFGEERITVDSQMVRRPGKYNIIFCYYNWNNYNSPNQATIEWWGINAGQNINVGGKNFKTNVNKGECVYAGTLNTH